MAGVRASASFCSAGSGGSIWPAWLAMTMPEPARAMIRPNSSRTNATPTRSTAMIAAGDACAGDRPAVWTRCITVPSTAAMQRADRRSEETSTGAVEVSKPAVCKVLAADCGIVVEVGQQIVLPTPIRRAMAWPMEPAPMTTVTSGASGVLISLPSRRGSTSDHGFKGVG